jgi:hypothetical protein
LEQYQEQPSLLDPYLEGLLNPLLDAARYIILQVKETSRPQLLEFHPLFSLLYLFTKVRGYKTIRNLKMYLLLVKFFSHEAVEMEPLLKFVSGIDKSWYELWEMRFVLLLWLSLTCLIPFDLKVVDDQLGGEKVKNESLMD